MLDYENLYNSELIAFKDCYKTCDSYCCSNFLGKSFKILKKNRVILPLLREEYLYYKSKGGIKNICQEKHQTYTLKNGKRLEVSFLYCECGGLCEPHSMRPLICRLYPYLPRVSKRGELLGFYPASLMDLFFSNQSAHYCTLVREHDTELRAQLAQNLKPLLRIPLYIFVFRSLEVLCQTLQEYLNNAHLDTLSQKDRGEFLQKLEWCLLSNKAWDNETFKEKIAQIYAEIAQEFGDFL